MAETSTSPGYYGTEIYSYINELDPTFKDDVSPQEFLDRLQDEEYAGKIYAYLADSDETFVEDLSLDEFIGNVKKKEVTDVTESVSDDGSSVLLPTTEVPEGGFQFEVNEFGQQVDEEGVPIPVTDSPFERVAYNREKERLARERAKEASERDTPALRLAGQVQAEEMERLEEERKIAAASMPAVPALEGREAPDYVAQLRQVYGPYGVRFETSTALGLGEFGSIKAYAVGADGNAVEYDIDIVDGKVVEPQLNGLNDFLQSNARAKGGVDVDKRSLSEKALKVQEMRPVARLNEDGSQSTVLMASAEADGRHFAYPTLFPTGDGFSADPKNWTELDPDAAFEEAQRRGELFEFNTAEEANRFAEGEWKEIRETDAIAEQMWAEKGRNYYADEIFLRKLEEKKREYEFLEALYPGEDRFKSGLTDRSLEDEEVPLEYQQYLVRAVDREGNERLIARTDIEEIRQQKERELAALEQQFDNDNELLRLKEDYDELLGKRRGEVMERAATLNQEGKAVQNRADVASINRFGVPVKGLLDMQPQTEGEYNEMLGLLTQYNTGIEQRRTAALQYEKNKLYYDAQHEKLINQEYVDGWEEVSMKWSNGLKRGGAMARLLLMHYGYYDAIGDEGAEEDAMREVSAIMDSMDTRVGRATSRTNMTGTTESFLERINPLDAGMDAATYTAALTAESLGQLLPIWYRILPVAAVGGAVYGAAGGPLGATFGTATTTLGAAGMGALAAVTTVGMPVSELALELGNSILEVGERKGYDWADPNSALLALNDESVWKEGADRGYKRGIPIAITGMVSNMVMAKAALGGSRVLPFAERLAIGVGTGVTIEPATEMLGEYAALRVSGEYTGSTANVKEIAAEGLGAIGMGVGFTTSIAALGYAKDVVTDANFDLALRLMDPAGIARENVRGERIVSWANRMERLGKIDAEQAEAIRKNVGRRRQANELLGKKIDSRPGSDSQVIGRIVELLEAKEELERSGPNVFGEKIRTITEEIALIAESGKVEKPGGAAVNLSDIRGRIRNRRPGVYKFNGKKVTREDFMAKIQEATPRQLKRARAYNDIEAQRELISRRGKDAIQKREAAEVPVGEQPRVSPQVDEQVREATQEDLQAEEQGTLDLDRKDVILDTIAEKLNDEVELTEVEQAFLNDNEETVSEKRAAIELLDQEAAEVEILGEPEVEGRVPLKRLKRLAANAKKAMAKNFAGANIIIHNDKASYQQAARENGLTGEGSAGFLGTDNKTVHIFAPLASETTIAHETFHVILRNSVDQAQIQELMGEFVTALKKVIPADSTLAAKLDEFQKLYDAGQMNEEYVAEFFGELAAAYPTLDTKGKSVIARFLERLGKLLGVDLKLSPDLTARDKQILSLLERLAGQVSRGETVTARETGQLAELARSTSDRQQTEENLGAAEQRVADFSDEQIQAMADEGVIFHFSNVDITKVLPEKLKRFVLGYGFYFTNYALEDSTYRSFGDRITMVNAEDFNLLDGDAAITEEQAKALRSAANTELQEAEEYGEDLGFEESQVLMSLADTKAGEQWADLLAYARNDERRIVSELTDEQRQVPTRLIQETLGFDGVVYGQPMTMGKTGAITVVWNFPKIDRAIIEPGQEPTRAAEQRVEFADPEMEFVYQGVTKSMLDQKFGEFLELRDREGFSKNTRKAYVSMAYEVGEVALPAAMGRRMPENLKLASKINLNGTVEPVSADVRGLLLDAENVLKSVSRIMPELKIVVHEGNYGFKAQINEREWIGGYSDVRKTIYINAEKSFNAEYEHVLYHELFHALLDKASESPEKRAMLGYEFEMTISKVLPKDSQLLKDLREHTSKYELGLIQFEEFTVDFFGKLAASYKNQPSKVKGAIKRFIERVSNLIGYPVKFNEKLTDREQDILALLDIISKASVEGEILAPGTLEQIAGTPTEEGPFRAVTPRAAEQRVVTNEDGSPKTFYHGTDATFEEFVPTEGTRTVLGVDIPVTAPAFFFTEDEAVAREYGKNVIPANLSFAKMVQDNVAEAGRIMKEVFPDGFEFSNGVINYDEYSRDENWIAKVLDDELGLDWMLLDEPEFVDALKAAGFDGTLVYESDDETSVAAFDNSNIQRLDREPRAAEQRVDVDAVRLRSRSGNRVSKGLATFNVDGFRNVEEIETLTRDYVREEAPEVYIKNANVLAKYPLVRGVKEFGDITTVEQADELYDIYTQQTLDNLRWMMETYPDEFSDISTLWYDGANKIANDMAAQFGVTPEQAAGILAALSPQKDWYQNVRLAELLLEAFEDNPVMTREMVNYQRRFTKNKIEDKKKALKKARAKKGTSRAKAVVEKFNKDKARLLNDIAVAEALLEEIAALEGTEMLNAPAYMMPYYVRLHSETTKNPQYQLISPDGEMVGPALKDNGKPAKWAWGSYSEIGKAVSIKLRGGMANITLSLGQQHKVRNFFNNIIDPMSAEGDVTMDTHAIAVSLLKPLSTASAEVGHNFGDKAASSGAKGIKGTYYANQEAYQMLAEEMGLLPRQVQSVTWEAVRGLFTDKFKSNKENVKAINQIWENYADGKITIDEARAQVLERAGGVNPPVWADSVQGELGRGVREGRERGAGRTGGRAAEQRVSPDTEGPTIVYRSGAVDSKAEPRGMMSGDRSTGHFGTGAYFFSDRKRAEEYDDRDVTAVDIRDYNLAPASLYLHKTLRKINGRVKYKQPHTFTAEEVEAVMDAIRFPGIQTPEIRAQRKAQMPEAERAAKKATRLYNEPGNIDSASTSVMKALGYEGVYATPGSDMDNSTYGTVIYDVKPGAAEQRVAGPELARVLQRYEFKSNNSLKNAELAPELRRNLKRFGYGVKQYGTRMDDFRVISLDTGRAVDPNKLIEEGLAEGLAMAEEQRAFEAEQRARELEERIIEIYNADERPFTGKDFEARGVEQKVAAQAMAEPGTIADLVTRGRELGLRDAAIRSVLLKRFGKDNADAIDTALTEYFDMFRAIPEAFGNVEGGIEVGRQIYDDVRRQLDEFARPKKPGRMTTQERTDRIAELRAKFPEQKNLSDTELLRKHPRQAVAPSIAEVRAEALNLLRNNRSFNEQTTEVQEQLLVAFDKTLQTKANKQVNTLISQIRNNIRQRRKGAKNARTVKTQLRKLINEVIPRADYTKADVNRLNKLVAEVNEDNYFVKAEQVLKIVDKKREQIRQGVIRDIVKFVRGAAKTKRTPTGKVRPRSLDAPGQAYFREADRILRAILDKDQSLIMDIAANLANNPLVDVATQKMLNGEKLTTRERQLVDQKSALDMFADIKDKSLEEVEAILEDLKVDAGFSRANLKATRAARAERMNALREGAKAEVQDNWAGFATNEDGSAKTRNQLEAEKTQKKTIGAALKENGLRAKYDALVEWAKEGKRLTPAQIARTGKNITHVGSLTGIMGEFFRENLYKRLGKLEERHLQGIFETQKKLDEIAATIDGIENYRDITDLIFTSNPDGLVVNTEATGRRRLSTDEMMRIYALSKNPVQRAKLERMGFTDAVLNQIVDAVDNRLLEFVDKTVEYLANDYYESINDVYRKVNDINLGYIENYFPTRTQVKGDLSVKSKEETLSSTFFGPNAQVATALKERTDQKGDILMDQNVGFHGELGNHFNTMERFKAYAEGVQEMNAILSSDYTVALAGRLEADAMLNILIAHGVTPDMFMSEMRFGGIDTILSKYTGAALAFKLMQIVKQATSALAGYQQYTYGEKPNPIVDLIMFSRDYAVLLPQILLEGITLGKYKGPIASIAKDSATFRARLESNFSGDVYGLTAGVSGRPRKVSEKDYKLARKAASGLRKLSGSATAIGDILGVLGYLPAYNRNRQRGMSQEEAIDRFNEYNETQQSRRPGERAPIQIYRNGLVRLVTAFTSSQILYLNNSLRHANNISKALRTGQKVKAEDSRGLIFNTVMASVLFTLASNAFLLLYGSDEEKQKAYKDTLLSPIKNFFAIPLWGAAMEEFYNLYVGNKYPSDVTVNPLGKVVRDVKKVATDGDVGGAVKSAAELALGTNLDPGLSLIDIAAGEPVEPELYDLIGVPKSARPE